MSTIGRYYVKPSKQEGMYDIEWNSGLTHDVVCVDLIGQIDQMIERELSIRKHFSEIFNLIFHGSEEAFLKHPDHVIMDYLDSDIIPNAKLSSQQIFLFNVKVLLLAYNRWKGTALKYKDVERFLSENIIHK